MRPNPLLCCTADFRVPKKSGVGLVIPANAGIQSADAVDLEQLLDPRVRGDDDMRTGWHRRLACDGHNVTKIAMLLPPYTASVGEVRSERLSLPFFCGDDDILPSLEGLGVGCFGCAQCLNPPLPPPRRGINTFCETRS